MIIIQRETPSLDFTRDRDTGEVILLEPAMDDRPLFDPMTGEQYTDPLKWVICDLLTILRYQVDANLVELMSNGKRKIEVTYEMTGVRDGDDIKMVLTAMIDDGKEGL